MRYRALAGDRLDDRDAALHREVRDRLLGQRIAHAAAGDEDGFFRRPQQRRRLREPPPVGARTRDHPYARLEEELRVVERQFRGVLRQREEGWSAIGWVEHHRDGLGQRRDDLSRMRDAIPIARHGLEGVVHRDGRIAEMLDLLQHRIGQAIGEGVAGDEQHREAVGVGRARRGHHVQRPRPDR